MSAHTTVQSTSTGGTSKVFASGSIQFGWGLLPPGTSSWSGAAQGRYTRSLYLMQKNILADMGALPGTSFPTP
jgi:hypothetical protein